MEQYIAGGVGGFTGVASSYWLDTLRINYQEGKYKTIRDCFRHICKSDGLRSLYRGASVNIIGISGEKSVVFGTYNFVKQMQYITNSYTNIFFAGICAGIASLPIVTPVEKN